MGSGTATTGVHHRRGGEGAISEGFDVRSPVPKRLVFTVDFTVFGRIARSVARLQSLCRMVLGL